MSAIVDLAEEAKLVTSGMDSVVIRHYGSGIIGGRTLDMTGFPDSVIKAGHLVIRVADEDGNYTYKPMPVSGGAYDSLPASHECCGFVVCSKPANEAMVGIMDDGRVNSEAMPYPITGDLLTAVKAALPKIILEKD